MSERMHRVENPCHFIRGAMKIFHLVRKPARVYIAKEVIVLPFGRNFEKLGIKRESSI